jgi:hypothetical protein
LFDEKNQRSKISCQGPFKLFIQYLLEKIPPDCLIKVPGAFLQN